MQKLSTTLTRITAPNAGFMTGNGTNTYIIQSAANHFVIIDPGPEIDAHFDAIKQVVGRWECVLAVLVTHTHIDHSPLAMRIAQHAHCSVYSSFVIDDSFQDKNFVADIVVSHNQKIVVDNVVITCVYTPGHVNNHMCYLYENERVLMTGDHLMQGSTVVIIPPQGDMKKYLQSLALLKDYSIDCLAPGHGDVITTPYIEIENIIQHRQMRENKAIAKLSTQQPITLEDLTKVVYDDVDERLHVMASYSLLAHLIKLKQENKVREDNGVWSIKI